MENILNQHYHDAHQKFGVILHVFDYTENWNNKWLPCPRNQKCHDATHRDRWTGSFIYKKMPFENRQGNIPIFADGIRGGIIYNISNIKIRCIYGEDGNTRYKLKGCEPQCKYSKSIICGNKSFNKTSFFTGLKTIHHKIYKYNEVVIDTNMSLPDSVLAFFYPANENGNCCRQNGNITQCKPQGDCRKIVFKTASRFSNMYSRNINVVKLNLHHKTNPFAAPKL